MCVCMYLYVCCGPWAHGGQNGGIHLSGNLLMARKYKTILNFELSFTILRHRVMDWLLLTYNLFSSLESSIISPTWLKGVIKRIKSLTLM